MRQIQNRRSSEGKFSAGEFLLNVLVESFESDGFCVEPSNCVNDFPQLLISKSILELIVDVLKLVNTKFSLSLKIIQTEIRSSSFFSEWSSLNLCKFYTILVVMALKKSSKVRASPLVSATSTKTLKTMSNFSSKPRVLAVMMISLTSALLCLGSA